MSDVNNDTNENGNEYKSSGALKGIVITGAEEVVRYKVKEKINDIKKDSSDTAHQRQKSIRTKGSNPSSTESLKGAGNSSASGTLDSSIHHVRGAGKDQAKESYYTNPENTKAIKQKSTGIKQPDSTLEVGNAGRNNIYKKNKNTIRIEKNTISDEYGVGANPVRSGSDTRLTEKQHTRENLRNKGIKQNGKLLVEGDRLENDFRTISSGKRMSMDTPKSASVTTGKGENAKKGIVVKKKDADWKPGGKKLSATEQYHASKSTKGSKGKLEKDDTKTSAQTKKNAGKIAPDGKTAKMKTAKTLNRGVVTGVKAAGKAASKVVPVVNIATTAVDVAKKVRENTSEPQEDEANKTKKAAMVAAAAGAGAGAAAATNPIGAIVALIILFMVAVVGGVGTIVAITPSLAHIYEDKSKIAVSSKNMSMSSVDSLKVPTVYDKEEAKEETGDEDSPNVLIVGIDKAKKRIKEYENEVIRFGSLGEYVEPAETKDDDEDDKGDKKKNNKKDEKDDEELDENDVPTDTLEYLFRKYAKQYNISSKLLKGFANHETRGAFDQYAVSYAGASGLMQIMPLNFNAYGIDNAFDAEQSIRAAAMMISNYQRAYGGDLMLTVAAYNAGPGNVEKYGRTHPSNWPPEDGDWGQTIEYIDFMYKYMEQPEEIVEKKIGDPNAFNSKYAYLVGSAGKRKLPALKCISATYNGSPVDWPGTITSFTGEYTYTGAYAYTVEEKVQIETKAKKGKNGKKGTKKKKTTITNTYVLTDHVEKTATIGVNSTSVNYVFEDKDGKRCSVNKLWKTLLAMGVVETDNDDSKKKFYKHVNKIIDAAMQYKGYKVDFSSYSSGTYTFTVKGKDGKDHEITSDAAAIKANVTIYVQCDFDSIYKKEKGFTWEDEDIETVHDYLDLEDNDFSEMFNIVFKAGGGGAIFLNADENGIPMVPYINQGAGVYNFDTGQFEHTEIVHATFPGHPDVTLHDAGCGFCATAMALSFIKQQLILPTEFMGNGCYCHPDGGANNMGVTTGNQYGVETVSTQSIDEAYEYLKDGNLVMAIEGGGYVDGLPTGSWTESGHFILLIGVLEDETIAVNDSGSTQRCYWTNGKQGYTKEQIDIRAQHDSYPTYTVFLVPEELKSLEGSTEKGNKVAEAAKKTGSIGFGMCEAWAESTYRNAGINVPYYESAKALYLKLPDQSRESYEKRKGLQPGMAIAFWPCNGGASAQTYGHVGIYIGNNKVMDQLNGVQTHDLNDWLGQFVPANVIPRWGYIDEAK